MGKNNGDVGMFARFLRHGQLDCNLVERINRNEVVSDKCGEVITSWLIDMRQLKLGAVLSSVALCGAEAGSQLSFLGRSDIVHVNISSVCR